MHFNQTGSRRPGQYSHSLALHKISRFFSSRLTSIIMSNGHNYKALASDVISKVTDNQCENKTSFLSHPNETGDAENRCYKTTTGM